MPKHKNTQNDQDRVVKQQNSPMAPTHRADGQSHLPSTVQRVQGSPSSRVQPADVLTLQRTVGNQAVQRMLATHSGQPTIQRLTLDDTAWDTVTAMTLSQDGADGVYFADAPTGRLVVKLTDDPHEVPMNNAFMRNVMGISSPAARAVAIEGTEGGQIAKLIQTLVEDQSKYKKALKKSSHFLVMEFAQGTALKRLKANDCNDAFASGPAMYQLGMVAVADAFLNIGDRLLANQNPGNVMINVETGNLIVIDNERHPDWPVNTEEELARLKEGDPSILTNLAQRSRFWTQAKINKIDQSSFKQGVKAGLAQLAEYCSSIDDESHPHYAKVSTVMKIAGKMKKKKESDSESKNCVVQ